MLIDKDGIVRLIDRAVNVRSHGSDILKKMKELKLANPNSATAAVVEVEPVEIEPVEPVEAVPEDEPAIDIPEEDMPAEEVPEEEAPQEDPA